MKKLILAALIAIFAVSANAQKYYLGGSLGFWRNDDTKTTSFNIAPEAGINVSDRFAIGLSIGYGYADYDGSSLNTFAASPYARYTCCTLGPVKLFLDGGADFSVLSASGDKYYAWGVGIKPGVSFDINEKFSILAHVGFLGYRDVDSEVAKEFSKVGFNKGWGLNFNSYDLKLGVQYKF